jgi:hypothetical protein
MRRGDLAVADRNTKKSKSAKRKPTRQEVKYFKDGAVCGKEDHPERIIVSDYDVAGLIARKVFRPRKRGKWMGAKRVRPTMWCIDPECRYPLDGLLSNRCPECGREFDPNNPHTYLASRKQIKRISKWDALLVSGLVIAGLIVIHDFGSGVYDKLAGFVLFVMGTVVFSVLKSRSG